MSEKPIRFLGHEVRAILEGCKTQTRRVVKPQPERDSLGMWRGEKHGGFFAESVFPQCFAEMHACPYGKPGDRLWVRETWGAHLVWDGDKPRDIDPAAKIRYAADGEMDVLQRVWRPSIHMPRWASRINLLIKDVRVERLQEISEEDARAEGVRHVPSYGWEGGKGDYRLRPVSAFQSLWDSINAAKHPWESNPWVWVLEFERIVDSVPVLCPDKRQKSEQEEAVSV